MSLALATDNQTDQRENYCKLLIWWKSPDEIDDQELLRRIMNLGTWEMWQWAWKHFTKESFIHCLEDARYGDFSKGSWYYWHLRLSISPIPPIPRNRFLIGKRRGEVPRYMSFKNLDLSVLPQAPSVSNFRNTLSIKYFRPKSNIILNILDFSLIY